MQQTFLPMDLDERPPEPPPKPMCQYHSPLRRHGPSVADEGIGGIVAPVRAKVPRSSSPTPATRLPRRSKHVNNAEREDVSEDWPPTLQMGKGAPPSCGHQAPAHAATASILSGSSTTAEGALSMDSPEHSVIECAIGPSSPDMEESTCIDYQTDHRLLCKAGVLTPVGQHSSALGSTSRVSSMVGELHPTIGSSMSACLTEGVPTVPVGSVASTSAQPYAVADREICAALAPCQLPPERDALGCGISLVPPVGLLTPHCGLLETSPCNGIGTFAPLSLPKACGSLPDAILPPLPGFTGFTDPASLQPFRSDLVSPCVPAPLPLSCQQRSLMASCAHGLVVAHNKQPSSVPISPGTCMPGRRPEIGTCSPQVSPRPMQRGHGPSPRQSLRFLAPPVSPRPLPRSLSPSPRIDPGLRSPQLSPRLMLRSLSPRPITWDPLGKTVLSMTPETAAQAMHNWAARFQASPAAAHSGAVPCVAAQQVLRPRSTLRERRLDGCGTPTRSASWRDGRGFVHASRRTSPSFGEATQQRSNSRNRANITPSYPASRHASPMRSGSNSPQHPPPQQRHPSTDRHTSPMVYSGSLPHNCARVVRPTHWVYPASPSASPRWTPERFSSKCPVPLDLSGRVRSEDVALRCLLSA